MKKILVVSAILAIFSTNSFAKTEGNYVGISLINSSTVNSYADGGKDRNDNISLGADYKYAFNFGGFFIAPGLFYDHNALSQNTLYSGTSFNANLKYSYGIKANIGYDVTDSFAPFLTIGHSQTRNSYGTNNFNYKENYTNEGMILGAGFKYSLNDSVDLNASYEIVQFGLTSNVGAVIGGTDKINPTYKVARVGASYHF